MRHAKRRRLTVEDFDKALKWSGIEVSVTTPTSFIVQIFMSLCMLSPTVAQPLYGHHTPDAPHFTSIPQMALYSVHDPEVKLEDIAMATPVTEHTLPDPPSVKGTYYMLQREREGGEKTYRFVY